MGVQLHPAITEQNKNRNPAVPDQISWSQSIRYCGYQLYILTHECMLVPVSRRLRFLVLPSAQKRAHVMVHWVDDIFHVEASNLANYMKLGILVHFDMLFPSRGGTRLKNEKFAANCCITGNKLLQITSIAKNNDVFQKKKV